MATLAAAANSVPHSLPPRDGDAMPSHPIVGAEIGDPPATAPGNSDAETRRVDWTGPKVRDANASGMVCPTVLVLVHSAAALPRVSTAVRQGARPFLHPVPGAPPPSRDKSSLPRPGQAYLAPPRLGVGGSSSLLGCTPGRPPAPSCANLGVAAPETRPEAASFNSRCRPL